MTKDFSDNENSLGSSPNTAPANQTNQNNQDQGDGKQPAEKPVRPNPDVEGGNGPVNP